MPMFDYMRNGIMSNFLLSVPFSFPTTLYFGLLKSVPSSATPYVDLVEVDSTGYTRASLDIGLTNWTAADSGCSNNIEDIEFPSPTEDWGTVVGVFITDVEEGEGNLYWYGGVDSPVVVNSGDPPPTYSVGKLMLCIGCC